MKTLKCFLGVTGLSLVVACSANTVVIESTPEPSQPPGEPPNGISSGQVDPATPTMRTIPTVLPTPEGQLLRNANFENGVSSWEPRIGDFLHSIDESHTGEGSGRLVTSELDARGDYSALVGQCVSLSGESAAAGEGWLEVAMFINSSQGGSFISLSGVFTDDEQCRGSHVGTFSIPVDQGTGWMLTQGEIEIPEGAGSLDFLISCGGDDPDAGILVDDVHLNPQSVP